MLRLSVFNCLLLTKNSTFKGFVARVQQDILNSVMCIVYTPNMMITAAINKYKNMQDRKVWNKLDPQEAQMAMLLTITVKSAQSQKSRPRCSLLTGDLCRHDCSQGISSGNGGTGGGGGKSPIRYKTWQTEFKGNTLFCYGKNRASASSTTKEKDFMFVTLLTITTNGPHQRKRQRRQARSSWNFVWKTLSSIYQRIQ